MVDRLVDMPDGTVGFKASGKLTREDYTEVLEPAINEAIEAGEVRMLYLLTDFEGLEPGAWVEDAKTGVTKGLANHQAWKRSAIVTDVDWIRKGALLFAWMVPGEIKVCEPDELDEAKAWVAG